jgi:hypothetical protein
MLTINKDNIQDLENNIWDILTIHPSMQISLGTNNSEFTEYDWEELKNKFIPFYLNLPSYLQKRINIKKFFFEGDEYSNNGTFSLYLENDGRLHIAYPLATTIIRPLNQLDGYVFNSYINNNVLKIYQE